MVTCLDSLDGIPYSKEGVVRGHHVLKLYILTSFTGEFLAVNHEIDNFHDFYAIAVYLNSLAVASFSVLLSDLDAFSLKGVS